MTRGAFCAILKVKELMKMAESIMLEKAKDFAVNIVNLCKHIKETKQKPC